MIGWSQRTATMASFLLNFNDVKCLRNSSTTIEVLNNNVVVYDLIFVKLMDQQNQEICISDLWLQYVWRDDWDHIARVRRRSRVGGTELAGKRSNLSSKLTCPRQLQYSSCYSGSQHLYVTTYTARALFFSLFPEDVSHLPNRYVHSSRAAR